MYLGLALELELMLGLGLGLGFGLGLGLGLGLGHRLRLGLWGCLLPSKSLVGSVRRVAVMVDELMRPIRAQRRRVLSPPGLVLLAFI